MGKLNDIRFTKTNGGMGRTAASDDPISGLVMYLPELTDGELTSVSNARQFDKVENVDGNNSLYVARLRYPEELADYGLEHQESLAAEDVAYDTQPIADNLADGEKHVGAVNALVYHVEQFFKQNPEGTLYLGVKKTGDHVRGNDLKAMQVYANGALRQCGVFTPNLKVGTGANAVDLLSEYQTTCTDLEADHTPMSVVVAVPGKTMTVTATVEATETTGHYDITVTTGVDESNGAFSLPKTNLTSSSPTNQHFAAGRCNVSLLAGCDLDPALKNSLVQYGYYGCIGICLGAISKAAVHESIAWVGNFPLGMKAPGLISGEPIRDVSTADKEKIHGNRYIFVITHAGDADNYFNDSHTLDVDSSDYAYIENVRTIDKACRGIRSKLLPWLNSPLRVDPSNGQLESGMVSFLETTAGEALEEMEKAGELSGYKVEIDPDQNVISTSEVEIIIKKVPVGVMRKVHVKIGFTTKLS